MIDCFFTNYVEILGTIFGLLYIWLSVKQNIALWSVGLLSSGLYIVVFFRAHLYADMSLNIYYLLVSIYGWIHWHFRKVNTENVSLPITKLSFKNWTQYFLVTLVLILLLYWLLRNIPQVLGFTPSSLPFWDAIVTAGSITATWMLARKVLEQWLWWVAIDSISILMFLKKELFFTSGLFVIYTVMAVWGFLSWQKEHQKQLQ